MNKAYLVAELVSFFSLAPMVGIQTEISKNSEDFKLLIFKAVKISIFGGLVKIFLAILSLVLD